MLPVYDWDSGRYLGEIPQAAQTYATIGNMNEHSLIIAESTYGGREEPGRSDGSHRLRLAHLHHPATRQDCPRSDPDHRGSGQHLRLRFERRILLDRRPERSLIMEPDRQGLRFDAEGNNTRKGIVWVARRIPDGYVSAHANQSRITTFPLDDPENCLYAPDVISFAREKGYFNGPTRSSPSAMPTLRPISARCADAMPACGRSSAP